jgi:hypothetical protein
MSTPINLFQDQLMTRRGGHTHQPKQLAATFKNCRHHCEQGHLKTSNVYGEGGKTELQFFVPCTCKGCSRELIAISIHCHCLIVRQPFSTGMAMEPFIVYVNHKDGMAKK